MVRAGRRMDGELKVVEMIVDKTGLLQALSQAEGTMEAEGRAENIQEFMGVAAEFERRHEDIEGTLESLKSSCAAGAGALEPQLARRRRLAGARSPGRAERGGAERREPSAERAHRWSAGV